MVNKVYPDIENQIIDVRQRTKCSKIFEEIFFGKQGVLNFILMIFLLFIIIYLAIIFSPSTTSNNMNHTQ